jgi:hypothetical protein
MGAISPYQISSYFHDGGLLSSPPTMQLARPCLDLPNFNGIDVAADGEYDQRDCAG